MACIFVTEACHKIEMRGISKVENTLYNKNNFDL